MEIPAHFSLKACGSFEYLKVTGSIFRLLELKYILRFSTGIARKLASSGYGVFAMDYPGFGLSEGLHGFIPNFDTIVGDVMEHYSKVKGNTYDLSYEMLDLFLRGFLSISMMLACLGRCPHNNHNITKY